MSRLSILLIAVVTACGGKSTPPPTTPLPADPAPVEVKKEEPPAEAMKPPEPLGPVEVKIPSAPVTVKLVSAGKGKKAPLRYSAKAGEKHEYRIIAVNSAGLKSPPAKAVATSR